ncbi:MAG: phosphate ABC transporter substrate-binding protein PstS [Solirubrobacteraceae bacterium]
MRSPRLVASLAALCVLALGVAACGSSSDDNKADSGAVAPSGAPKGGTINGAGATFPAPVYDEWAARYKDATGTTINYQAIGSGGGVAQFTAGTVDFGATDAAMDDDEIKAAAKKGAAVHIPTVAGAVTVSYNLPGVAKGLKLDGPTVASIFLGKVTKWNDPAIAGQNQGVELPDSDITVCHRSDESGTTKLFTTFLAAYSPQWKKDVGVDKTVKWPTGTGAKGNDGVAACVKQNEGAVGYVEQAYALENNFTYASVKNKAGKYVAPTLDSTTAAVQGLEVPRDLRFDAINTPSPNGYPIASSTFMVVYQDMCKAGVAQGEAERVKGWLDYATGAGQKVAPQLSYAPEPAPINAAAKAKVKALQCNGKPLGG